MIPGRIKKYLDSCCLLKKDKAWLERGMARFVSADPGGITKYQFGFQLNGAGLVPGAMAMNIDANAYACKSTGAFGHRVDLFRKAWGRHGGGELLAAAARVAGRHPMDIYGGMEVRAGKRVACFWLIYGGADKQGRVHYCAIDREMMTQDILREAGCRMPLQWREKAFHLALFHDGRSVSYEVYYEGVPPDFGLEQEKRTISALFRGHTRHFCSGELFDGRGRMRQRRIFLYLPLGVSTRSPEALRSLLSRVRRTGLAAFPVDAMTAAIAPVCGELNLFGFSAAGEVSLYLDTWKGYENHCPSG